MWLSGTLGRKKQREWQTLDRLMDTRVWFASKPAVSDSGTPWKEGILGKVGRGSRLCDEEVEMECSEINIFIKIAAC